MVMVTSLGESFADTIEPPLFDWVHNPPHDKKPNSDLFVVLVADTRSVLFIYQPQLAKVYTYLINNLNKRGSQH